jgi:hypothetical protein
MEATTMKCQHGPTSQRAAIFMTVITSDVMCLYRIDAFDMSAEVAKDVCKHFVAV